MKKETKGDLSSLIMGLTSGESQYILNWNRHNMNWDMSAILSMPTSCTSLFSSPWIILLHLASTQNNTVVASAVNETYTSSYPDVTKNRNISTVPGSNYEMITIDFSNVYHYYKF